jgi:hypothetical protein
MKVKMRCISTVDHRMRVEMLRWIGYRLTFRLYTG